MKDVYYKQLDRYPTIKLSSKKADELVAWFKSSKLSPLIPPIYQDFVIKTDGQAYDLVYHDKNEPPTKEFFTIERCCHVQYNDAKTKLRMTYFDDRTRILTVDADYQSFDNDTRALHMTAEAISTRVSSDEIEKLSGAFMQLVFAVQAYILYHKPEEIEREYTPPKSKVDKESLPPPLTLKKSSTTRIKKTVGKIINIPDSEKPPRKYNYHTLSWSVRGHYRRVGKNKELRYISPQIRNRSKPRKTQKRTIEILDD